MGCGQCYFEHLKSVDSVTQLIDNKAHCSTAFDGCVQVARLITSTYWIDDNELEVRAQYEGLA